MPDGSAREVSIAATGDERGPGSPEDGVLRGYRALPGTGAGPGVLVLGPSPRPEETARGACERLARAGFLALASPWDAAAPEDLAARGVHALLCDSALVGGRVGVLGFGAGGAHAIGLAARERRIAAVVSFEGTPSRPVPEGTRPPVLLVFGGDDAEGAAAARALAAREPSVRMHGEPGAAAGFLDAARADRHAALAAARAWDAALAFLRGAS